MCYILTIFNREDNRSEAVDAYKRNLYYDTYSVQPKVESAFSAADMQERQYEIQPEECRGNSRQMEDRRHPKENALTLNISDVAESPKHILHTEEYHPQHHQSRGFLYCSVRRFCYQVVYE